jgi:hypothetical protein
MVYIEWYDYENNCWQLSKMNIFKALFCVLFDVELGCRIVPRNQIKFY